MAKITIRIAEQPADWLARHFTTKTEGAEFAVNLLPRLYRHALADMRGMFSAGELSLMLDASNGVWLGEAGLAGQHLPLTVADAIRLDGAATKWDLDGDELLRKLDGLSLWHRLCLELWAVGFWRSGTWEADAGMDTWMAVLREEA